LFIYLSDTKFANMIDYYPTFTNLPTRLVLQVWHDTGCSTGPGRASANLSIQVGTNCFADFTNCHAGGQRFWYLIVSQL
jgi:hypothetical protein